MSLLRSLRRRLTIAAVAANIAPSVAVADASHGEGLAHQWCAGCHGAGSNEPSPNPHAPGFSTVANDPAATEYSLHVFLQIPHDRMPNIILTPDQIDDLVSYIETLKTRPR